MGHIRSVASSQRSQVFKDSVKSYTKKKKKKGSRTTSESGPERLQCECSLRHGVVTSLRD